MHNTRITCIVALFALISGAASAQGFYVGGSLGQSNTKFKSSDYTLEAPVLKDNHRVSRDKTDTALKIFAGYKFNRYIAVEGGYADLGKPQYKLLGTGPLSGVNGKAQLKQNALFVAAKGTLPINEQFNLFGKLGLSQNKSKISAKSNSTILNTFYDLPLSKSSTKTGLLYGIGAEYAFSKQFSLRLEYENFGNFGSKGKVLDDRKTGRTKTDLWSLGVSFNF